MKIHPFCLITALSGFSCLLLSCDKKSEPPVQTDPPQTVSKPSPAPAKLAPKPMPKPAPKVNVAQLNKELSRALLMSDSATALKAIEAGADPHAKNRYGLPVIFTVAQSGNAEMIKALVAKGADPNAKIGTTHNTDGQGYAGTADGTPLGYAAAKGKLETMEALVAAGADVNGTGLEGTTPLMQAVDSGKFAVVEYLINQGADANAKLPQGANALSMATMYFNPDPERQKIIQLLKSKTR